MIPSLTFVSELSEKTVADDGFALLATSISTAFVEGALNVRFSDGEVSLFFFISLLVSYGLRTIIISSDWLSKISIAILFLGLLIDIWKKDQ